MREMKCKPRDLAIVVDSGIEELVGLIVEVLEATCAGSTTGSLKCKGRVSWRQALPQESLCAARAIDARPASHPDPRQPFRRRHRHPGSGSTRRKRFSAFLGWFAVLTAYGGRVKSKKAELPTTLFALDVLVDLLRDTEAQAFLIGDLCSALEKMAKQRGDEAMIALCEAMRIEIGNLHGTLIDADSRANTGILVEEAEE